MIIDVTILAPLEPITLIPEAGITCIDIKQILDLHLSRTRHAVCTFTYVQPKIAPM